MPEVIRVLGRILRFFQLVVGGLEAVGRKETDLFLFMKNKENIKSLIQLITVKVPFLTNDFYPGSLWTYFCTITKSCANNDRYIIEAPIQAFLERFAKAYDNAKKVKANYKISFYRINFAMVLGKKPPIEEILQLADKLGLRGLNTKEVILFRHWYTQQPAGETLLASLSPVEIFDGGNETFLTIANIRDKHEQDSHGNNPFVRTIGFCYDLDINIEEIQDVILVAK